MRTSSGLAPRLRARSCRRPASSRRGTGTLRSRRTTSCRSARGCRSPSGCTRARCRNRSATSSRRRRACSRCRAMPLDAIMSSVHSPAPAVSGLAMPTCFTTTGTCGRPSPCSLMRKSAIAGATLPSAMIATLTPLAAGRRVDVVRAPVVRRRVVAQAAGGVGVRRRLGSGRREADDHRARAARTAIRAAAPSAVVDGGDSDARRPCAARRESLHVVEAEHRDDDPVERARHVRGRRVRKHRRAVERERVQRRVERLAHIRRAARRADEEVVRLDGDVGEALDLQVARHLRDLGRGRAVRRFELASATASRATRTAALS